jgi:RimJ/RimL family protein N-acetyltransferase
MPTVEVVAAAQAVSDPAVAAMIASASNDHDLCHATYLPAGLDETAAVHWIGERVGRGYAIHLDKQPVGWVEIDTVKDSCGFDLPAGSAEFEIWLLPHARGKHLFRRSLTAIEANLLATGVTHLVGVAWVTNHASIKAMRNSGFTILGDGWWGDLTEGGLCTVGVLQLGNSRPEPATA